ncbi:uncharacterized protein LOC125680191 [Ostrea edulis]|uniref:uncharacterized protein LOC125680191 n=1 Tax=Ostrea edulis TaxID=37623 RepID=UPI0024AED7CA|nr:uncharacterized protein LOC125680191 [Ostrea edulis]
MVPLMSPQREPHPPPPCVDKRRLPSIAEERFYIDKAGVSSSFQDDLSFGGIFTPSTTHSWYNLRKSHCTLKLAGVNTTISYIFSSWLKTCQENLKKIDAFQKQIAKRRISFDARDGWEVKEFTLFENMFETEEKLKSVCHQFQRITSTMEDRVPLKDLRNQRMLAHKTQAKLRPQAKRTKQCPKEVKLPPIKRCLGRLRATTKDSDRQINTVQTALQPVVHRPGAEPDVKRSSQTAARPTLLRNDHTRSKLPVRDERLATKEFISFKLPKKNFSSQHSKLPLRNMKVAKELDSPQKTKLPSSNIGAMRSGSLNSGEEFKAVTKPFHTMSNPFLPIPPIGGRGVRTSTNLRMRHFNHQ